MTQREGRILRRGNSNEHVRIFKYVTKGSFDAYSWQTIENKLRFVRQVMSGQIVVRSAEDIDETVLAYAEIKAIATGDPRIMRKTEIDMEILRLDTLFSQYRHTRYKLEDRILKHIPAQIAVCKERIHLLEKDSIWLDEHTTPDFSMQIGNQTFDNRKDAGTYLLSIAQQYTEETDKAIGYYKGFQMLLRYDAFDKETGLILKNTQSYNVTLGIDSVGSIKRIDHQLSQIAQEIQTCKDAIVDFEREMNEAKVELERPFEYTDQLAALQKEQQELNLALNLDQNEEIIAAGDETGEKSQDEESEID